MSVAAHPADAGRASFDLNTKTGEQVVFLRFGDRGVRLDGDRIGWSENGERRERRLHDVIAVNLLTAIGTSPLRYGAVACAIRFNDGTNLRVFAAGGGLGAQSPDYVRFVAELHRRLVHYGGASIVFTTGYSLARYRTLAVLISFLGLLLLGGGLAILLTPGVQTFLSVAAGAVMQWTLYRTLQANAPRRYNPAHIPQALLSGIELTGLGGPSLDAVRALPRQAADPLFPFLADPRRRRQLKRVAIVIGAISFAGAVAWTAGVDEAATMLEPGQAERAFAAIEHRAGGPLQLRNLTVTAHALNLTVESRRNHVDGQGLMSTIELWRAAHATLFSGWREWERVSGPTRAASLPIGYEGITKPFALRPRELTNLAALGKAAFDRAGPDATGILDMQLEQPNPPRSDTGHPLLWTIHIGTTRGQTTLLADGSGRFIEPETGPKALGFPANILSMPEIRR